MESAALEKSSATITNLMDYKRSRIISRWAPPSDNNPTEKYADYVAKECGVASQDIYPLSDNGNLVKLLAAVFRFELGQNLVTDEQIEEGVSLI